MLLPELAVTCYPPEDLLLRPGFIRAAEESLRGDRPRDARPRRARRLPPLRPRSLQRVRGLRRRRGEGRLPQALPPELRRLRRGPLLRARRATCCCSSSAGRSSARPSARTCGSRGRRRPTSRSPARSCSSNISASPFHVGRDREREEMFATRARDNACFVAFCNAVGGQDELIFDGHSLVLDDEGHVLARAPGFEEALLVVDIDPPTPSGAGSGTYGAGRLRANEALCPMCRSCSSATAVPTTTGSSRSSPGGWASSSRCASPSSSGCATTWARTASARSSSASRAGSTRR